MGRREVEMVLEIKSDVEGHPADAPVLVTVPETATLREAALMAIRTSNIPTDTKTFIERILLGESPERDVVAQPKVIGQGGAEVPVALNRQVGEVIRSTGSNRIVLHVAPVVGCGPRS